MGALAGLQQAQISLNGLTEVGSDLIEPVPLEEEDSLPQPNLEDTFVMGAMAVVVAPSRTIDSDDSDVPGDESSAVAQGSYMLSE